MRIKQPFAGTARPDSVVRAEYLSHGTLECYSLEASRRFYEEFLGLECVRHAKPAMAIRCGLKFHIVCLEVGDKLHPANVDNHWGLDVGSAEEVERIWKAAHDLRDEYRIGQIMDLVKQHGTYSFYFEDLDHNWWEIQYYDGIQHDDMFDFGDRYSAADLHEPNA
ncbi:Glyoxalase-like domain protein [Pigmentiphaga humi]|uniref:Glyoxalase-like domain protein n=1 Tax=Pigmentiphaga humi TaxID=2478468 RepID=A0A3P4AZB1_9BURK|nr:VOC family protein [Pigmentiphaga humi]VCU68830.1 Glyoxalase-like domain protein [Pigmentiphaga humi]